MRQQATCHPERFNKAYGLCTACYAKQKYWKDPEKFRAGVRKYRANNLEKAKRCQANSYRKTTYGISLAEFEAMAAAQNNECSICHIDKGETLHIDHDHDTGKVRGLLCSNCNRNLGWYEKKAEAIKQYLNGATIAGDN